MGEASYGALLMQPFESIHTTYQGVVPILACGHLRSACRLDEDSSSRDHQPELTLSIKYSHILHASLLPSV